MTTQEIAAKLVAHCRQAAWEAAHRELYADHAVSLEPVATPAFAQETRGLPAIIAKGHTFTGMVETLHAVTVSDPLVAPDSFACTLTMDLTLKGQPRRQMSELCVYEVKDGRIVSERFFR